MSRRLSYPATAEGFFQYRRPWLEDPDAVRAVQNENGQWAVFVKIDGWYSRRQDAEKVATRMRGMIRRIVGRM